MRLHHSVAFCTVTVTPLAASPRCAKATEAWSTQGCSALGRYSSRITRGESGVKRARLLHTTGAAGASAGGGGAGGHLIPGVGSKADSGGDVDEHDAQKNLEL